MSDRPIAAIAALSIVLVATCGCSKDETPLDYDLPEGLVQVAVPIGCTLVVLFCVSRIIVKLADKVAATQ